MNQHCKTPWIKSFFDKLTASILVLFLSPVMVVLSLAILIKLGPPVFFCQTRPGLHGIPFKIFKYRTMSNARDKDGNLLPDNVRLTAMGAFLRKTSMDELPELFNVVRGEMSLVGPRPLLMKYLPYYTEREKVRYTVKPGITGWAQINGRNQLPWSDRLEMDVWYVENWSFWLDLKILLMTVYKVIKRDGVAVDTYVLEPDLDEERKDVLTKE